MCSDSINKFKDILSGFFKLILILPILLAGCGDGNNSPDDNMDQSGNETVSFKLPDSIAGKLPSTGTLSATISVNGKTAVPLTISSDNTTATATISNIATGNATIIIIFTYDDNFPAPLVVASLEKNITVSTGDNAVSILASDYVTSIHDEDGDGISNLDELDENSTSSPFVSNCVLGTDTLGNCEL